MVGAFIGKQEENEGRKKISFLIIEICHHIFFLLRVVMYVVMICVFNVVKMHMRQIHV